jgi:hypothetical protein
VTDEREERMVVAFEQIASGLGASKHDLVSRVATLEDLIKDVVTIIENPESTDTEWAELLEDLREALG